jgi:DnaD/phage-associated family protein
MNYIIKYGAYPGIFALPTQAADKYLNEASHVEIKVLLYVFRHCGEKIDESAVCAALKITAEQFRTALDFWAERKIFVYSAQNDEKVPAVNDKKIPAVKKSPEKREEEKTQRQSAAQRIIDMPIQYGEKEISKKSQSNPEIKFLLETVPDLLGRLISPSECSSLVYLYDGAGLPADVIIMIVEYCVASGKGNMRYIQKMALSWADEGIDTHEKAELKMRELEQRGSYENKIRSIMGINDRALSQSESQYIARWCEWKMPDELVKLAYDIGVERTGKLSFPYINSILKAWHDKGFTKIEQAKNENKRGRNATSGKSPSFDIDEYVRLSMKKLHNE